MTQRQAAIRIKALKDHPAILRIRGPPKLSSEALAKELIEEIGKVDKDAHDIAYRFYEATRVQLVQFTDAMEEGVVPDFVMNAELAYRYKLDEAMDEPFPRDVRDIIAQYAAW